MTPTRFPRFFEENAVLPSVLGDDPTALDPDEEGWLDAMDDDDFIGTSQVGEAVGPPRWLFAGRDGAEEEGGAHEVEVPSLNEVPRAEEGQPPSHPAGVFTETSSPGLDAIATYSPWHFYGSDWGIRIYEPTFNAFVQDIAFIAKRSVAEVEPFALHQVLEHELTHFEYEIVGTEYERLTARPVYRTYMFWRFKNPSPWSKGPLEEAVATHQEVVFARRRSPRPPNGYLKAVKRVNSAAPPGYRDWKQLEEPRRADLIYTHLQAVIADEPVRVPRYDGTSQKERDQIPVIWVGSLARMPGFLIPKTLSRPTPRQLRRWLRKNGATLLPSRGKGSHEGFEWHGRRGGFATSRAVVPKDESENIARIFGLRNAQALYEAIASDARIPASSPPGVV